MLKSRPYPFTNFSGEFGVVYKGHILKNMGQIVTNVVAIKTLKGKESAT